MRIWFSDGGTPLPRFIDTLQLDMLLSRSRTAMAFATLSNRHMAICRDPSEIPLQGFDLLVFTLEVKTL